MLQRPRLSRIYFGRNFFPYPIGITLSVAWRLGLVNTALIGLSYIKAQLVPWRDETYLDATRRISTRSSSTGSASGCTRRSFAAIPRRCGACRAARSARTGERSA